MELAIPKLRAGSYFPSFLEHRRRAERALASVVATSYLLGVSTRRVEKLAASLGVVGLLKSQVSAMAAELDALVESFRKRPLDRGPYTFVWIDALTQKVREGGRTVNVHCLIATGVNADGYRQVLGIDVTSSEDGAGWLAFLRGLAARGLSGVQLVTSDDHAGLVSAIAAVLPGAAWQRCRTHYHRNLLTRVSKTAQPWVSTLVRTIFEQPGPDSVRAQHAQVVAVLEAKLPAAAAHLDEARDDILAFTAFPRRGVAAGLVQQPAGAAEQGGPQADRRGGDLPWPRRHHPPGRRGAGRAERRMDRVPPLHGTGNPRRLPESRPARHGTG
jgi:transposase-like protein